MAYNSESSGSDLCSAEPRYGSVEQKQDEDMTSKVSKLQNLMILLGLCVGTYVGVTTRIYLSFFSDWDGVLHFPSLWAQVVGTVIIGGLAAHKEKLQQSYGVLYTSLSTGLCGSLTTFSSWNAEAAKVLLQLNETTTTPIENPVNASRVVGSLTVLLLGIGMPVSAFLLGKNLALLITVSPSYKLKWQCHLVSLCEKKYFLVLFIYLAIYTIATTIIIALCLHTNNYHVLFSLLFGCTGTYIRWYLSFLDKRAGKYFPIGTFLANSIGSLILAGTLIAIGYCSVEIGIGKLKMAVLTGIATGFCGSLTTVSTFTSQICSLPFISAVIYTVTSLCVAQVIFTTSFAVYGWIKV